jgi:hypothetical protein
MQETLSYMLPNVCVATESKLEETGRNYKVKRHYTHFHQYALDLYIDVNKKVKLNYNIMKLNIKY